MKSPAKTIHSISLSNLQDFLVSSGGRKIAFEYSNPYTWTIVEHDGENWIRASEDSLERVRQEVFRRDQRDGTIIDMLITTLIRTLVKVQEHEDGQHSRWVLE